MPKNAYILPEILCLLVGINHLPPLPKMMADVESKRQHNNLYIKSQRHTLQVST